jgi:uncharacterized membrane protein YdjX (TVP38/TMEM64 family)
VSHRTLRRLLVVAWLVAMSVGLYFFLFQRAALRNALSDASSASFVAAAGLYLLFGCLRGFTLMPSTTLVLLAVPFFPPGWLFALTFVGILVSSTSLYFFAEALHLGDIFTSLHGARLARLKTALARYELPVIVAWSFFPLAPTDLICYACGIVGVDFWKCLVGVAIGEGAICATYIFLGDSLLKSLGWR